MSSLGTSNILNKPNPFCKFNSIGKLKMSLNTAKRLNLLLVPSSFLQLLSCTIAMLFGFIYLLVVSSFFTTQLFVTQTPQAYANERLHNIDVITAHDVQHRRQLIADLQRLRMHNITRYQRLHTYQGQGNPKFEAGSETIIAMPQQQIPVETSPLLSLGW